MIASNTLNVSLKKDDQVQVIAGREKGKVGKVLRVNRKTGRVTVEKINMVKRHTRPSQTSPQGGIPEKESSLHYSNVLLYCGKCNRGVRHGVAFANEGPKKTKQRVCKRCGEKLGAA